MGTNKRMFQFLKYDLIHDIGVFWFVLLIVNVLSSVITFSVSTNNSIGPMIIDQGSISFVGSNFFAAFVFFIVYGLEMYYEKFSLAIGFGGTRKRFYLNVLIDNLLMVLMFSVIQVILLRLEYHIISMSSYNPLVEFGLFNISEDSILSIIFSLSLVFLILASITNLIGVLQYRFGYKFWVGLGIFVLASQMITNFIGRNFEIFFDFITGGIVVNSIQGFITVGFLIILLAYAIGFLFIRKADIK